MKQRIIAVGNLDHVQHRHGCSVWNIPGRRSADVIRATQLLSSAGSDLLDSPGERPVGRLNREEETGQTFAGVDRKSGAIRQKGVKLRSTEQESGASVNIVPGERMVSSSSIDFLSVSSIGL